MIDLHCHILPGIDDGAPDLEMALAMARVAWDDGIRVTACTPHIYPGLYENDLAGIARARDALASALEAAGIPLQLTIGADAHLTPTLLSDLRKTVPTLHGSRYFLLEPPHHVAPPRLAETVFSLVAAGYVPIITHPERLTWIEAHYPLFGQMVSGGAWMQVTAGSLTGRFGKRPLYWAERMEDEGLVHVVATDAHRAERRPPLLAEARDAVVRRLGDAEALHQVQTRPQGVLDDASPASLPPTRPAAPAPEPFWRRLGLRA
jgi:protein-tyrosine phosphatase